MSRIVLLACLFTVAGTVANAQAVPPPAGTISGPVVGGGAKTTAPALPTGIQSAPIVRHRDPTGKPCLTLVGTARGYTTNTNLYDHLVTATNACAQRINMEVCYYRTQKCISMEVPGRMRKEAVLGIMPSIKDFRYEFREKF